MYSHRHSFRTRYSDTDQMGYIYYGRYAEFFEMGRVEAFRSLGISYKDMEDNGILMPVLNLNVNYYKPLFYDELVTVETIIPTMPLMRIAFAYKMYNEAGELTADGATTLVFVDAQTRKPMRLPANVAEALAGYFG